MSGTTSSLETSFRSFYVAGGTVPVGSAAYVTRRADEDLFNDLLRGEFCYILTSRQMGKSSLMARTAARLREEGLLVGVIDLTSIGHDLDREQWYYSLLMNLAGVLRMRKELRAFWEEREDLPPLQRWMEALRFVLTERPSDRLVIFIDEIDTVLALPFEAGEFFAAIRSCLNRRSENPEFERLTLCLLGVANPSDLISDTRLTPFNIGRRIELNDFTEHEARALEAGLGSEEIVRRAVLERVLHWTGGHPYLTQRLCQALVESGEVIAPELADRLCDSLFLSSRAREQDDNLIFVRDRLLKHETVMKSEEELAALLDLYRQVWLRKPVHDDKAVRLIGVLRLSGIVRSEEGLLRVRNRIYAQVFDGHWITEHMPNAELRRQRAAYRRGVLRTVFISSGLLTPAFIFAVIALVMGRQAVKERDNAVKQTVLANYEKERAEGLLYASDMNVVSQTFNNGEYGRVAKTLEAHIPTTGPDRRGFEWWYYWGLMHQDVKTLTHEGNSVVLSVAYTCDGNKIVSANSAGTIKMWDARDYQPAGEIDTGGHTGTLVAASPKRPNLIASAGDDGSVNLWDTQSLKLISPLCKGEAAKRDRISALAFSCDGSRLAYCKAGKDVQETCVCKLDNLRDVGIRFPIGSAIEALAFVPGTRWLASGNGKGQLVLLDTLSQKVVRTFDGESLHGISALCASPDGRQIAIGGSHGSVALLNLRTRAIHNVLASDGMRVGSLAFSPNGARLVVGSWSPSIRIVDVGSGRTLTLPGHTGRVTGVQYSPDGNRLLSGGGKEVKVWEPTRFRENPERVPAISGGQLGVGFPPSFGSRGFVQKFTCDLKRESLILTREADSRTVAWAPITKGVQTATVSDDGKMIAEGTEDGRAIVWDLLTHRQMDTLQIIDKGVSVFHLRFSHDGACLAASGGDSAVVTVWDVRSRKRLGHFKHSNAAEGIAFSPDGRTLAVASWEGALYLWEFRQDPEPDPRKLKQWRPHAGFVRGVAFSPDGKTLATSGEDKTVKLWNVATTREMVSFKGLDEVAAHVQFSPDGRALMAAIGIKWLRLWKALMP